MNENEKLQIIDLIWDAEMLPVSEQTDLIESAAESFALLTEMWEQYVGEDFPLNIPSGLDDPIAYMQSPEVNAAWDRMHRSFIQRLLLLNDARLIRWGERAQRDLGFTE